MTDMYGNDTSHWARERAERAREDASNQESIRRGIEERQAYDNARSNYYAAQNQLEREQKRKGFYYQTTRSRRSVPLGFGLMLLVGYAAYHGGGPAVFSGLGWIPYLLLPFLIGCFFRTFLKIAALGLVLFLVGRMLGWWRVPFAVRSSPAPVVTTTSHTVHARTH